MLQRKPKSVLHRTSLTCVYAIANPVKRIYRKTLKPRGRGVKCFIFNNNKLLLVRIGYAHKSWVLPGGAIDRGETSQEAAVRELYEESGLRAVTLEKSFETTYDIDGMTVVNDFYVGTVNQDDLVIDDYEIIDAGWFYLDALPEPRRQKLDDEIKLYQSWVGQQKHS